MSLELLKGGVKSIIGKLYATDKITCIFNILSLRPKFPKMLTFHRVIDPEELSYPIEEGMYVRPKTFKMLIEYLANEFELISVPELINRIESQRELSNKTVILTFDDAWYDNYLNAFPVLKSLKIPATIFIPTYYVSNNKLFLTDQMIILLNELKKNNKNDFLKKEDFNKEEYLLINNYLSRLDGITLEKLLNYYKYAKPEKSYELIRRMESQFADTKTLYSQRRSFLNWDEIREMSQSNITFASHSHSHVDLTKIAKEKVKLDIENSLEIINKENIQFLKVFCYPGGYYNNLTQEVLKEFDFKAAFITAGPHNLSTHPKILSRINMHDDICKTKHLFRYTIGL